MLFGNSTRQRQKRSRLAGLCPGLEPRQGRQKKAQRFIAGCLCANETSPVRDERNRLFGDTLPSPLPPSRRAKAPLRRDAGRGSAVLTSENPRLKPWAIIGM